MTPSEALIPADERLATAAEKAGVLIEALPWLQRFHGATVVVKYGGNAVIADPPKHPLPPDMGFPRPPRPPPAGPPRGGPPAPPPPGPPAPAGRAPRGCRPPPPAA